MSSSLITDLLEFLGESTSPFHAVAAIRKRLEQAGFTELASIDEVPLAAGHGYFTARNDSSIIAVRAGSGAVAEGIRLVGAHTDSPNLSVKPNGLIERDGLTQLAVDVYGGALLNPWFDRDLSLAGRVNFLTREGALSSCLLDFKRPVAIIPSLAIHLDREANSKRSVNAQTDILPVLCHSTPEDSRTDLHALL
ncbi:MAG: M18 family aminopeptidase, partial [Proteobacteria bacterium]|nr:M18 family aminopeptidase [Pseudomonadota bacterium]